MVVVDSGSTETDNRFKDGRERIFRDSERVLSRAAAAYANMPPARCGLESGAAFVLSVVDFCCWCCCRSRLFLEPGFAVVSGRGAGKVEWRWAEERAACDFSLTTSDRAVGLLLWSIP